VVRLFQQLLKPGAVVVEAGANIGALTVPMARAVGDTGRIIAYEPQWVLAELLRRNAAANALGNIDIRNAALGAAPGAIEVPELDYARAGNYGGVALGAVPGRAVALETIDGLALAHVDLIKIDVEGMESEVLAGAVDTLRRLRPILYVENDREEKSRRLISDLLAQGYRLWWHVTALFNPDNFARKTENVFGLLSSFNMLCLPAERPADVIGIPVTGPDDTWSAAFDRARGG
jgi:FkbM family methyltransferase